MSNISGIKPPEQHNIIPFNKENGIIEDIIVISVPEESHIFKFFGSKNKTGVDYGPFLLF
jgi:hypothetical protein